MKPSELIESEEKVLKQRISDAIINFCDTTGMLIDDIKAEFSIYSSDPSKTYKKYLEGIDVKYRTGMLLKLGKKENP